LSNFEHKEWFEILQVPDKLQSVDYLLGSVAMRQRLDWLAACCVLGSLPGTPTVLGDLLAHQRTGNLLGLPDNVQGCDDNFEEDEVEVVVYETYEGDEEEEDDYSEEEEMDIDGRRDQG